MIEKAGITGKMGSNQCEGVQHRRPCESAFLSSDRTSKTAFFHGGDCAHGSSYESDMIFMYWEMTNIAEVMMAKQQLQ